MDPITIVLLTLSRAYLLEKASNIISYADIPKFSEEITFLAGYLNVLDRRYLSPTAFRAYFFEAFFGPKGSLFLVLRVMKVQLMLR